MIINHISLYQVLLTIKTNKMKKFRNPYYSIILSSFFLLFSCEKYYITEKNLRKINYIFYENNKNNPIFDKMVDKIKKNQFLLSKSQNEIETYREITKVVNDELDTDYEFSDEQLDLISLSHNEILDKSLNEGWITFESYNSTKIFISDFEQFGMETAIIITKTTQ